MYMKKRERYISHPSFFNKGSQKYNVSNQKTLFLLIHRPVEYNPRLVISSVILNMGLQYTFSHHHCPKDRKGNEGLGHIILKENSQKSCTSLGSNLVAYKERWEV